MGAAVGSCVGASVAVALGVGDGDGAGEADWDGEAEAVGAGDGLGDGVTIGAATDGPEHATTRVSVAASASLPGLIPVRLVNDERQATVRPVSGRSRMPHGAVPLRAAARLRRSAVARMVRECTGHRRHPAV